MAGSDIRAGRCPKCGSIRNRIRDSFVSKNGSRRRLRSCVECNHRFYTNDEVPSVVNVRRLKAKNAKEKKCSICKQILPIVNFGKSRGDPDLYRSECRTCVNKRRRMSHATKSVFQLYGLKPEFYRSMMMAQKGKCAICGMPENKGRALAVDHCHVTKIVRGLLCNKCNMGIGNFNDDPCRLEAAARYIRNAEVF